MKKILFICLFLLSTILLSQTTPVIKIQPYNVSVSFGQVAAFEVFANSDGPLGYQWWKVPFVSVEESKLVNIVGKIYGVTTKNLRIHNCDSSDDQTKYVCEVKNLDKTNSNEWSRLLSAENTTRFSLLANDRRIRRYIEKARAQFKTYKNKRLPTLLVIYDVYELIGAQVYLYMSVGDHSFVAAVDSHTKAKDGAKHQVVFNNQKIHLFDKDTEKAIL